MQRIVKIMGEEALPDAKRLTLEAARWLKEGFLQQSAFDPGTCFAHRRADEDAEADLGGLPPGSRGAGPGIPFYQIRAIAELTDLLQMKSRWGEDQLDRFEELANTLAARMEALVNHGSA